ncbi:uncharacterized protein LOC5514989 isoform X2 [Nematostella vectensis]|nr:uncharacterized protein LOC5514989 isoform X2 [Nematostella vectensis]XP_048585141.1 uncharacterized protein LOC5514989 isoform X2 [Nematostella vectensis]XP_048585142.1 uncharacterized protein LOC5514989 isoform X2 [Nematostella vectensis]
MRYPSVQNHPLKHLAIVIPKLPFQTTRHCLQQQSKDVQDVKQTMTELTLSFPSPHGSVEPSNDVNILRSPFKSLFPGSLSPSLSLGNDMRMSFSSELSPSTQVEELSVLNNKEHPFSVEDGMTSVFDYENADEESMPTSFDDVFPQDDNTQTSNKKHFSTKSPVKELFPPSILTSPDKSPRGRSSEKSSLIRQPVSTDSGTAQEFSGPSEETLYPGSLETGSLLVGNISQRASGCEGDAYEQIQKLVEEKKRLVKTALKLTSVLKNIANKRHIDRLALEDYNPFGSPLNIQLNDDDNEDDVSVEPESTTSDSEHAIGHLKIFVADEQVTSSTTEGEKGRINTDKAGRSKQDANQNSVSSTDASTDDGDQLVKELLSIVKEEPPISVIDNTSGNSTYGANEQQIAATELMSPLNHYVSLPNQSTLDSTSTINSDATSSSFISSQLLQTPSSTVLLYSNPSFGRSAPRISGVESPLIGNDLGQITSQAIGSNIRQDVANVSLPLQMPISNPKTSVPQGGATPMQFGYQGYGPLQHNYGDMNTIFPEAHKQQQLAWQGMKSRDALIRGSINQQWNGQTTTPFQPFQPGNQPLSQSSCLNSSSTNLIQQAQAIALPEALARQQFTSLTDTDLASQGIGPSRTLIRQPSNSLAETQFTSQSNQRSNINLPNLSLMNSTQIYPISTANFTTSQIIQGITTTVQSYLQHPNSTANLQTYALGSNKLQGSSSTASQLYTRSTLATNQPHSLTLTGNQFLKNSLATDHAQTGVLATNQMQRSALATRRVNGAMATNQMQRGALVTNQVHSGAMATNQMQRSSLETNQVYSGAMATNQIRNQFQRNTLATSQLYTGTTSMGRIQRSTLTTNPFNIRTLAMNQMERNDLATNQVNLTANHMQNRALANNQTDSLGHQMGATSDQSNPSAPQNTTRICPVLGPSITSRELGMYQLYHLTTPGPIPRPKVSTVHFNNKVMLIWTMEFQENSPNISLYELYAAEIRQWEEILISTQWRIVGAMKALKLPMACTLTNLNIGMKSIFIVRAVTEMGQRGAFSKECTVHFSQNS